ncbi:hypothetical protein E6Q11_05215 [Candidatus Dojkabacteria bacterium]|uniref:Uncharacterized protein n=1 Tax=Candidatus Dojkabacteria bacterium TaxID=2099670 RepID=A0A5C7J5L6_9BACT|nr:MAG: hypothetical protein E6Q11_05215 [Candidatus Dojkabacteria bacterium]
MKAPFNDTESVANHCKSLMEEFGPSKVFDFAKANGIHSDATCLGCDANVPHLGSRCLICGQDVFGETTQLMEGDAVDKLIRNELELFERNPSYAYLTLANGIKGYGSLSSEELIDDLCELMPDNQFRLIEPIIIES